MGETTLQTLNLTIKERRLRWLGHVFRVDDSRLPKQAIYWKANNRKWRPGKPRKNWQKTGIVQRDMKEIGLSWEEADLRNRTLPSARMTYYATSAAAQPTTHCNRSRDPAWTYWKSSDSIL